MDDKAMPISIIRSSAGFFDGGRLADKISRCPAQAEALAEAPGSSS